MTQVEREAPAAPVVKQWRRWGKNRLYVHADEETQIGWWDLQTGEAHPEEPDHLAALTSAALAWCSENGVPPAEEPVAAPVQESDPEGPHTPAPVAHPSVEDEPEQDDDLPDESGETGGSAEPIRPWSDLATNPAGEGARFMAHTRLEAAPVKSLLARALRIHTDERAWRIGAEGEEKVAAQLRKMTRRNPRWRVLHSIPVGTRGSDIDHLVIGPGGVFTLNAKHHPKAKIWVGGNTFLVNGTKQSYIRNSRHEARRASQILAEATGLTVQAHGVIVPVNAGEFTVKSQPEGVTVVPRMQVGTWLVRHGDVLAEEQVHTLFEAARRSTTWR